MPCAAQRPTSTSSAPGSSSAATRSRAGSLPRWSCFSRAASPPPSRSAPSSAESSSRRARQWASRRAKRSSRERRRCRTVSGGLGRSPGGGGPRGAHGRGRVGGAGRQRELPEGAPVRGLRARLAADHPALTELWARTAVAVNGELAAGDAAIPDGAEVALLPPVSGGRAPAVALVEEPLDPATVAAAVSGPDCGAVVLFVGTVRDHHHARAVERLTYTAYRAMAERRLGVIAEELQDAHAARLAIAHRLGDLVPGEASVVIAAAAPHREAAYRASRDCLERLKREVPIWKREHYDDGTARWREEEPLVAGGAQEDVRSPTA